MYNVIGQNSENTGSDRLITKMDGFFVEISIIKLTKMYSLRMVYLRSLRDIYKGTLIHKPTIIIKMLLGKVVCFVFILTLTVLGTDLKETFPQGSCGWDTSVSYNPNRIPKKITETVCFENGGSCGANDTNAKVFFEIDGARQVESNANQAKKSHSLCFIIRIP